MIKTKVILSWVVSALLLLMAGCANPVNRVTFKRYYTAGYVAENNKDYSAAKENYYRALVNARIGNLEPQLEASAAYSLGRMLGIQCDLDNAEKLLLEALQIDQKSNGPVHMSYFELARLNQAQQKYFESTAYFEKALPLVDNKKFIEADPIGMAGLFDEYSNALKLIGRQVDAEKIATRAQLLRKEYPGRKVVVERTPYNENCGKK